MVPASVLGVNTPAAASSSWEPASPALTPNLEAVTPGSAHLDPVHTSLYLLQLHADLTVPDVAESGEGEGRRRGGAGPRLKRDWETRPVQRSPSPDGQARALHHLDVDFLTALAFLSSAQTLPRPPKAAPGVPAPRGPTCIPTSAHEGRDLWAPLHPTTSRRCEGGGLGDTLLCLCPISAQASSPGTQSSPAASIRHSCGLLLGVVRWAQ